MTNDEARLSLEAEGLFQFKKIPSQEKCCVKNCRSEAGNRRKKVGNFWFCHACWQTRYRLKSPKRGAYRMLMDHAAGRGLEFRLTYDYFLGLMDCAAAWDREAESRGDTVSIDRIEGHLGYVPGNVRVISLSANVVAGNKTRFLPANVQAVLARKRASVGVKLMEEFGAEDPEKCPF